MAVVTNDEYGFYFGQPWWLMLALVVVPMVGWPAPSLALGAGGGIGDHAACSWS